MNTFYNTQPKTQVAPYGEYLKTNHWKNVRRETYKRNNFCAICGEIEELNIHHLTYKNNKGDSNLFDERIKDLSVVCKNCHTKIHSYYGKKPQTINTIKKLAKLYRKHKDFDLAVREHKRDVNQFMRKKNAKTPKKTIKELGTMAFYYAQRQNQVS